MCIVYMYKKINIKDTLGTWKNQFNTSAEWDINIAAYHLF